MDVFCICCVESKDEKASGTGSGPSASVSGGSVSGGAAALVSADTVNAAHAAFLGLLGTVFAVSQRQTYMAKCVANLQQHHNVPASLTLLRAIISTYPQTPSKPYFTGSTVYQWAVIEDLDRKWHVLDHVLQDITTYKSRVTSVLETERKQHAAAAGAAAVVNVNGLKIDGPTGYDHLQQISIRTNFLQVILVNSSLVLTRDQAIGVVWEQVITRACSPEESDIGLRWFIAACFDDNEFKAFGDDVKKQVLIERILNGGGGGGGGSSSNTSSSSGLQPAALTETGYTLLERYLLRVNDKAGHLRLQSDTRAGSAGGKSLDVSTLTVMSYQELTAGIQMLWNIVLTNARESVGRSAILLLNSLHQNLHRKHITNPAAIREKYLTASLNHLSTALAGDEKSDEHRRSISRNVYLLKTFLAGFRRNAGGATDAAARLKLRIVPDKECRCDPFTLKISNTSTYHQLRVAVHERVRVTNPGITLRTMV